MHTEGNLPLFGVREVVIIEVCRVQSACKISCITNRYHKISIAGRESKSKQGSQYKGRFVGNYATEDLDAEKRRFEHIIASYKPQEFPCPYNPSTGQRDCFTNCISYILDNAECPEQTLYEAQRKLSCIKMRLFLELAFSDPGLATANGLLDGKGVINSHR